MYKVIAKSAGALVLSGIVALGTAQAAPDYKVPFMLGKGKMRFQELCAKCHGDWAQGTDQGPPLIHIYYEPGHHNDASFLRAMKQGVKQHHWGFGDMAPVPEATDQDARQIVQFLRWLQRENGIGLR